MSGAARKAANGVARGANTPLAVEKQSGDRSGDRPSLAVALTRESGEAGLGGERRRLESRSFVGAYRICVPSGKSTPPAGVKGIELLL